MTNLKNTTVCLSAIAFCAGITLSCAQSLYVADKQYTDPYQGSGRLIEQIEAYSGQPGRGVGRRAMRGVA